MQNAKKFHLLKVQYNIPVLDTLRRNIICNATMLDHFQSMADASQTRRILVVLCSEDFAKYNLSVAVFCVMLIY